MTRPERKKPVNKAVNRATASARPDYGRSAQDRFLSQMALERRKVVVFLTNGIKLEGEIKSFDEYAILLEGAMTDHVYKHAVSTIQPLTDVATKAESSVRKPVPRAERAPARKAGVVATVVGSAAETPAKEGSPRQPVIVIRPKRRLVKAETNED